MVGEGIRAGRAFVEIYGKDNTKAVFAKISRRAKAFSAGFARAAASFGIIGTSITAPLTKAVLDASKLQETISKFETVFGTQSKAVKGFGDSFAAEVGRSEEQIARFLSSTQDLLVPVGIDPMLATQTSKDITRLAVDLASFNNVADDMALRDLQAALTGSGETMKKYGVIVNEASVKQELFNKGINPSEATNAEKVLARLALIMKGTTAAQGDAIRTSGSFANQMKALQAAVKNTSAEIGAILLPTVTKLVSGLAMIVNSIREFVQANPLAVKAIAAFGAGSLLLAGALAAVAAVIAGVAGVITFLLSPMGLVVAAIAAQVAAFTPLILAVTAAGVAFFGFTEVGKKTAAGIKNAFMGIVSFVTKVFGGIVEALRGGNFKLAGQIALAGLKVAIFTGLDEILSNWQNWVKNLFSVFKSFVSQAANLFVGLVKGIASRISPLFAIVEKLRSGNLRGAKQSLEELVANSAGTLANGFQEITGIEFKADESISQFVKRELQESRAELKGLLRQANQLKLARSIQSDLIDGALAGQKTLAQNARVNIAEIAKGFAAGAAAGISNQTKKLDVFLNQLSGFSAALINRQVAGGLNLEQRIANSNERIADNTEDIAENIGRFQPGVAGT